MKIYISLDMEGMPGTFNWEQETCDRPSVKNYMYEHLQHVIEAIRDSRKSNQVEEITIADSHNAGDNIKYEITGLDERLNLISGCPRPQYMMPAFSGDYDYVFLLGYHAGTGAIKGSMVHTYANKRIHKFLINGRPMNEALVNAAYAGSYGVPVALITGDLALSREILVPQAMPWVNFVVTKEAVSKFAAKNYSKLLVREKTMEAVHKALSKDKKDYPVYSFESPVTLQIEFMSTSMAENACLMPHTKRIDGKTVEYTEADYRIVFDALMVLITLASSVNI